MLQTLITNNGFDLLSKAIAGQKLIFTRAALGDSIKNNQPFEPTDAQAVKYTSLVSAKMDLPIVSVTADGHGTAVVKCAINNQTLTDGFFIREIGLFAKIEGGAEKLYSYRNLGDYPKFIPASTSEIWNVSLNISTVISQATNIDAVIGADNFFVTHEELDEHIYSTLPHPNDPNLKDAVTSTDEIWACGNDNNLRPISINNISRLILGDDAGTIGRLSNRLDQTEINIANLLMQLNSEKEFGIDANLLIAEDFSGINSCTDTLIRDVNHEVGGINSVCLDDWSDILVGHFYTLSDGVRSEFVQCKSIAKNDELVEVIFTDNFTKNFDLSNTKIFRSTGNIMSGQLGADDDILEKVYAFEDVWQGESTSNEKILTLTTKNSTKKNFELDGDYSFTSDGFFTIA